MTLTGGFIEPDVAPPLDGLPFSDVKLSFSLETLGDPNSLPDITQPPETGHVTVVFCGTLNRLTSVIRSCQNGFVVPTVEGATVQIVPEPATALLVAGGTLALAGALRRRGRPSAAR